MKQTPEFSDRDLDALFDGREVSDERLHDVAAAFSAMRSVLVGPLSDEHAATMGERLAAIALSVDAGPARPHRAARWRRRFTAIGATAAFAVVAVGGAAAANQAVPGDALYGVDRALERVGIFNGGLDERLTEANHLAAKGDAARALTHAADAYDTNAEPEVASALLIAADAVRAGSVPGDANQSVADMLEWMATAERGDGFGQQVSAWARGLGHGRTDDASGAGSQAQGDVARPSGAAGTPGGGKDTSPGTVGKPDGVGRPDHAGQPGGAVTPPGQAGAGDDAADTPSVPTPRNGSDDTPAGGPGDKPDHAGTPGKPDHAGTPGKPDHAGTPGKPGR